MILGTDEAGNTRQFVKKKHIKGITAYYNDKGPDTLGL